MSSSKFGLLVRRSTEWGRGVSSSAAPAVTTTAQCLCISASALWAVAGLERRRYPLKSSEETQLRIAAASLTRSTTDFLNTLPEKLSLPTDTLAVLFQLLQRCATSSAAERGSFARAVAARVGGGSVVLWPTSQCLQVLQIVTSVLPRISVGDRVPLYPVAEEIALAMQSSRLQQLGEREMGVFFSSVVCLLRNATEDPVAEKQRTSLWEAACQRCLELLPRMSKPNRTAIASGVIRLSSSAPRITSGAKHLALTRALTHKGPNTGSRGEGDGDRVTSLRCMLFTLLSEAPADVLLDHLDHVTARHGAEGTVNTATQSPSNSYTAGQRSLWDTVGDTTDLLGFLLTRIPFTAAQASRVITSYGVGRQWTLDNEASSSSVTSRDEAQRPIHGEELCATAVDPARWHAKRHALTRAWDAVLIHAVESVLRCARGDATSPLRLCEHPLLVLAVCHTIADRGLDGLLSHLPKEEQDGAARQMHHDVHECLSAGLREWATPSSCSGPGLWAIATAADLLRRWELRDGPATDGLPLLETAAKTCEEVLERVTRLSLGQPDQAAKWLLDCFVTSCQWRETSASPPAAGLTAIVRERCSALLLSGPVSCALEPIALLRGIGQLHAMRFPPPLKAVYEHLLGVLTCSNATVASLPLKAFFSVVRDLRQGGSSLNVTAASSPDSSSLSRAETVLHTVGWRPHRSGSSTSPRRPLPDALLDLLVRLLFHRYAGDRSISLSAEDSRGLLDFFEERSGDPAAMERAFAHLVTRRIGVGVPLIDVPAIAYHSTSPPPASASPRPRPPTLPADCLRELVRYAEELYLAKSFTYVRIATTLFTALRSPEVLEQVASLDDLLPIAALLPSPLCGDVRCRRPLAEAVQRKAVTLMQCDGLALSGRLPYTGRMKAMLIAYLVQADMPVMEDLLRVYRDTAAGEIVVTG